MKSYYRKKMFFVLENEDILEFAIQGWRNMTFIQLKEYETDPYFL